MTSAAGGSAMAALHSNRFVYVVKLDWSTYYFIRQVNNICEVKKCLEVNNKVENWR